MVEDRVSRSEIEKWLSRMEEKLKTVKALNEKGAEFLKNIEAYVFDCKHFLSKGNYVLAFESIIWAWAWYEIGREIRILG